jgi:tetratricopeptide (TPR) repeat protein
MSRNNYSEAYHCFVSALQKKPDYSIARFNLAKTEYALTNYHEALTHFDYLIAQGEYHIESLMFKSIIFYERGMYDQSIENLNRVIAEKPDSVEAYTYLARNFRKMKRHDMADKLEQSLAALAQLKMNN